MRGIDHDDVGARLDQCGHPIVGVRTGADAGANTQLAGSILAGVGVHLRFVDVFDGNQTAQLKTVIDNQDFFDPMPVQQIADFVIRRTFAHRDQFVSRRHDAINGNAQVRFEPYIATRHDTQQVRTAHDGYTRNVVLAGQFQQFTHGAIWTDRDGIADDARFELLDRPNFSGLELDWHVLVHNADAAFLRHGNSQARFGHRVHCGGHQGHVEREIASQLSPELDLGGHDIGISGAQQDVIKREGIMTDSKHYLSRTAGAGRGKRGILVVHIDICKPQPSLDRPSARQTVESRPAAACPWPPQVTFPGFQALVVRNTPACHPHRQPPRNALTRMYLWSPPHQPRRAHPTLRGGARRTVSLPSPS